MKSPIRLLARTNNERGDLFTRLVQDLFFALGYDDLRFDVHQSGREIDIQGKHRLEPRRFIAECKAHAEPMGGADMNKFFGALGRERDKHEPTPVAGYFVSLHGFRETAREQEEGTSEHKRVILLDGGQVIDELIRAKFVIDQTGAAEQAGRCAARAGLNGPALHGAELLGHELGYLWALYYAQGKERTHVALVHADGTALSETVAREVLLADRECGGSLAELTYLAPPAPSPDRTALAHAAVARYRQWIITECGQIQLDGLPADADLSALRMQLERLFVPLKVVSGSREPEDGDGQPGEVEALAMSQARRSKRTITPVGEFLERNLRFSLLAKPGGGKSTLLKRLAVAYAEPDRLQASDDGLPARDWLPLYLRCRELRDRASRPIRELLDDLPRHAGMSSDEASVFRDHIDEVLRSGRALLLIDGLDEISDEGARKMFAGHLRTFLGMFPRAAMVITSREAGYRHVAGVIAAVCEQVGLAPFDKADVLRLCESWHVLVRDDTELVRADARRLAHEIWQNERIRALAENPLMLTTLLVVRRCIGELPTRRVQLYGEAVKVLIRTWNTEGFEPMDLDETLAQLSYVACAMMNEGIQRVGARQLRQLLLEARMELQPELQFMKISPGEFIERIEYRSSLLMQTGHDRIDGALEPVYEFRHLTFQEYLAAWGLVKEQYPGRDQGHDLVDLLAPHFEDGRWREVIPLAAVLAGRKAEPVIVPLTDLCAGLARKDAPYEASSCARALQQCLLDEVQVREQALRVALRQAARHMGELPGVSAIDLRRGKFGEMFQEVVEDAYFGAGSDWDEFYMAMSDLAVEAEFKGRFRGLDRDLCENLERCLISGDRIAQSKAAFVCSWLAFYYTRPPNRNQDDSLADWFRPLRDVICGQLGPDDPPLALAASWALAWMGEVRLPGTPPASDVMRALFRLWREGRSSHLRRFAAWAFGSQPLLPRDTFSPEDWGDCDALLEEQSDWFRSRLARLVLAWYRRHPWSDAELIEKLSEYHDYERYHPTLRDLLASLGEPGRRVLEAWDTPQPASVADE